jgi:hydroxymethylbilane synthase
LLSAFLLAGRNYSLPNQKIYKIGTRGSLLALTQCTQIKDELERVTGQKFELEVIKTQGDLIVDKPLWQLDGKDFFTKELDHALLTGDVDLVVHSYKDLGSERPEGITLGAVTKRTYAHDILFIRNETKTKLDSMKEFVVGTSSPRRITNLEKNLHRFIPSKNDIAVKTKMLRGNVNTRIQKLVDGDYDAIVLALPGIERLALSESSLKELKVLLKDLDYMILPQTVFPSAASQGALGIECLDTNGEMKQMLQKVEDSETVAEISRERAAFAAYGGGCHLAVGINVRKFEDSYIHIHEGKTETSEISEIKLENVTTTFEAKNTKTFVGLPESKNTIDSSVSDKYILKTPLKINEMTDCCDLFVTSNYCTKAANSFKNINNLWAAGTKTMEALVQDGHWVNGTSDSLGEIELEVLRSSKCIQQMNERAKLYILSHDKATSHFGSVIPTYERVPQEASKEYISELKSCEIFYWTSFPQYLDFVKLVPSIENKYHCCGLGKTYSKFKENNISVRPFSGLNEFNSWLKER